MSSLAKRSDEPEWMDGEAATPEELAACLRDLAAVNTVTLARLPTLGFMRRVARRHPGRVLRVLDVACGEGDMLRRLHRWGVRTGQRLELVGLDISQHGIESARAATPAGVPIEYRVGDVFDLEIERFSVVISSLFTHHLSEAGIAAFLHMMERTAALGWFVNDLHRHVVAHEGFKLLSAAAGWHRFVRHDGPISVARSFRREDWRRMLHRAALAHVTELRWHVPFRYCVSRFK